MKTDVTGSCVRRGDVILVAESALGPACEIVVRTSPKHASSDVLYYEDERRIPRSLVATVVYTVRRSEVS